MVLDVLDELELLLEPVADEEFIPRSEYAGSLDFIDRLPTEPVVSLRRDDISIANALFFGSDVSGDALPVGPVDNRRFDPGKDYDAGVSRPDAVYEPGTPEYDDEKRRADKVWKKFEPRFRGIPLKIGGRLGFKEPDRTDICRKRRERREVMHALGLSGVFRLPRYFNPYSWIRC